ncbi:MAG: septum formation initiator family protein [Halieaceae bacterium]|jgi:cell division protein FtsB|nr:septum formation initiator family protein [Halieaceae bacterium]
MRWLVGVLLLLVLYLQYRLWFAEGGIAETTRLAARIERERAVNAELTARNEALERQVIELQNGTAVLETRAREDLGLVKEDEIYYQFADPEVEAEPR